MSCGQCPPILVNTHVVDVTTRRTLVATSRCLQAGESILVGREGDVAIGVVPPDSGISRRALEVSAGEDGWTLTCHNNNGAILHPWAQPTSFLETGQPLRRAWPRLAVRLIGSRPELHHWVLLEADRYRIDPARMAPASTNTDLSRPPQPLTDAQRAALTIVFAEHLAWPPVAGPVPLTLQAAARRLGVSDAAIYQRLEAAQNRAYLLGAYRQPGVTDPDYLYTLIRHGYLGDPPASTTTEPCA